MLARPSAAAAALATMLTAGTALAQAPAAPPPAASMMPMPMPAPAPAAATEPRSSTMMIGGIVMAATGGALLHFAALYPVLHEQSCFGSCNNDRSIAGGMALAGVVAIAVGIPLLVVGARHVPARPAVLGAPAGAGWAWRF